MFTLTEEKSFPIILPLPTRLPGILQLPLLPLSFLCSSSFPLLKNTLVLDSVSFAVTQYYDNEQLREEKIYFSLQLSENIPLLREVKAGPQTGQGPECRS